jgi:hypothetical protein
LRLGGALPKPVSETTPSELVFTGSHAGHVHLLLSESENTLADALKSLKPGAQVRVRPLDANLGLGTGAGVHH